MTVMTDADDRSIGRSQENQTNESHKLTLAQIVSNLRCAYSLNREHRWSMMDVIVLATAAAAWGVLAEYPFKFALYYLTNPVGIESYALPIRLGLVALGYLFITVPNELLFPVLLLPAVRINLENKVRETVSTSIMKTLIRGANMHTSVLRRISRRARGMMSVISGSLLEMQPEPQVSATDAALAEVNHSWLQQLRVIFVQMVSILLGVPVCVRGMVLLGYLLYILTRDLPNLALVVAGGISLYAVLTIWAGVVVSDLFRNKQDSYIAVTDHESPIFALLTKSTDRPLSSFFSRRKDMLRTLKNYRDLRKTWRAFSSESMQAEMRLLKLAILRDLMLLLTKILSVVVALMYVGEHKLEFSTAVIYWSWIGMAAEPFGKLVDLQKILLDGLSYFERYEAVKRA